VFCTCKLLSSATVKEKKHTYEGVQELLYCVQCVKFSFLPCNLYIVYIMPTLKPVLCVCLNKAHFTGCDLVHKQNKGISQLNMSKPHVEFCTVVGPSE